MGFELLVLILCGMGLGIVSMGFGGWCLWRQKLPWSLFSEKKITGRPARIMSVVCILVGFALVGYIMVMLQLFPAGLR